MAELTRGYLKKRILVQDVGGGEFQTAGIRLYVEDLEPDPNTRIGPKDFFEMASKRSRWGDTRRKLPVMWLCICFALLVWAGYGCTSRISREDETAAVDAAKTWLTLMDTEQYAAGWQAAAAFLKESVAEDKWEETMSLVRKPMGPLSSRKVKSTEHRTMLPRVLKGNYLIIKFQTSFANRPTVEESITVMQEADGTWRVGGYHLE